MITWNVQKKLVMSTFRRLEQGARLCTNQTGEKREHQVPLQDKKVCHLLKEVWWSKESCAVV